MIVYEVKILLKLLTRSLCDPFYVQILLTNINIFQTINSFEAHLNLTTLYYYLLYSLAVY